MKLLRLDPANYIKVPWKNGGGISLTIAQQHKGNAVAGDWSSLVWQLGRTAIVAPAPFSDLAGFDRMQVLVKGAGLVLQTPEGAIDVRDAFKPVRFKGETPIVSKLEQGPVEVVNLMASRDHAFIDLVALNPGGSRAFRPGHHVLYAPVADTCLLLDGQAVDLSANHAAIGDGSMTVEPVSGVLLVASVALRS
jgi:uncharacterized protein